MSVQNLTEGALDKCVVAFRCPLTLKYKIMSKFGKSGDFTKAILSACDFATQGVMLDKNALDQIIEEQAAAFKERMRKRLERDMKRLRERDPR